MIGLQYAYSWITGISLFVMGIMIIILSAHRATEAQKYVSSIVSVTFLFFLGYMLYQTGNSLDYMLIGIKIELISILTIYIVIFMVFQQVYNVLIARIPMILITLWYVFLCVIVIMLNKNRHGAAFTILFSDYSIATSTDGILSLKYTPSWGFYAIIATLIIIQIITISVYVRALIISKFHKYKISSSFFLLTFIPQILIFISIFTGTNKSAFPFAPITCAIASLLATLMVSKELFSNLYDMAYKEIMNSMQNPLLIIDNSFHVRRINKAAKAAFPEYKDLDDSSYFKMKVSPEIQNIITPPMHESEDDNRYKTIGKNVYETEVHKIGKNKHLYGYLLILNNMTEQYSQSSRLQELTHKLSITLRTNKNSVITSREKLISGALQFIRDKDPATASHMRRVGNYAFILARQLRKDGSYTEILTDTYMETLCQVAPLHDVGKFLLPTELLQKTDLEPDQTQALQSHTVLGAQMIDRMIVNNYDDLYYRLSREIALYHHENWDGSGYIQGLRGEEIPLSARIVAGANAFDNIAMKTEHYNSSNFAAIFKELEEEMKNKLDPLVLEAIINAKEQFKELYEQVKSEGL